MGRPNHYHCVGCKFMSGQVREDCCTCCISREKQRTCNHPRAQREELSFYPEDPPEWTECKLCGEQWDII